MHALSNRQFLVSLLRALAALLVSAVILLAGWVCYQLSDAGVGADAEADAIELDALAVLQGRARQPADGVLRIDHLQRDDRVLFINPVDASADDYPFLSYRTAGGSPGLVVYAVWQTAEAPGEVFRRALPQAANAGVNLVHMAGHPGWTGSLVGLGFDVYGELRDRSLTYSEIRLLPPTVASIVAATLRPWLSRGSWTVSSINSPDQRRDWHLVPPAPALGLWALVAILLLVVAVRPRRDRLVSIALAALIAWLCLDLLWQGHLDQQLEEARYLFAGKTMHEKHMADLDGELYAHALRIREHLGDRDDRLFILKETAGHEFTRLKLQYYLWPVNSYNRGLVPPVNALKEGDFLLLLGATDKVTVTQGSVAWRNGWRAPVTTLDDSALGRLFLVTGAPTRD